MFTVAEKWVPGAVVLWMITTGGAVYADNLSAPELQRTTHQAALENNNNQPIEKVADTSELKPTASLSRYSIDLRQALLNVGNKGEYIVDFKVSPGDLAQFQQTLQSLSVQQQENISSIVQARVSADVLQQLASHVAVQQADIERVIPVKHKDTAVVLSSMPQALALLQRLDRGGKESLVFSPFSVAETGLTLLVANTRPEQLKKPDWFLSQFNSQAELEAFQQPRLQNSFQMNHYLWLSDQLKVNKSYARQYTRLFGGKIDSMNVTRPDKTVLLINKVIARDTSNRISDFLTVQDVQQAQAILLNTVYFKAQWQVPFFVSKTRPQPFSNAEGVSRTVPMMAEHLNVKYAKSNGWTLVELPFNQQGNTLTLVLPPPSQPLQVLDENNYNNLNLLKKVQDVHVRLPKVKLVGKRIRVNEWLPELASWPLDRLLVKHPLQQLNILHQATVEWDETGAQASAATATLAKRALETDDDLVAEFNRPFSFIIKDNEQVLFAGEIKDLPDVTE